MKKKKLFCFSACLCIVIAMILGSKNAKADNFWATNYELKEFADLSNPYIMLDQNGHFIIIPGTIYCCLSSPGSTCNLADASSNCP